MPMSPRLLRPIASGVHPDANDWRSRVVTNGGSVSASTMKAVSNFCADIDKAGIRDRFLRLNLFCGNSDAALNAVRTPLYRGQSRTGTQYGGTTDQNFNFVEGDYAETGASGGLVGNGSSKYLNTGLAPDSLPDILSGHLSAYMRSNSISGTQGLVGGDDGTTRIGLFLRPSVVLRGIYGLIVDSATNFVEFSFSPAYATGLYTSSRTSDVLNILYEGSTARATNSNAVTPASHSEPWAVFASNANGFISNYATARLAGYSIGTGLSATDMTAYDTAMQAFQAALSRTA